MIVCGELDSAVGVVSPLQLSPRQIVCQFASGAHLACYSWGAGGSSPRLKFRGVKIIHLRLEPKFRMSGTLLPFRLSL